MAASAYGERIARLEERVANLEETMDRVEVKLDKLLTLKDKGAGAFWLVSLIVSSGIITFIVEGVKWFSGR